VNPIDDTMTTAQPPKAAVGVVLVGVLSVAGLVLALGVGEFTARETYLLAIAGVVVLPIAASLYRRPVAVVALWLLLAPLVVVVDDSAARRVFWLVHRLLPLAAVGATLLGPLLGTTLRRLPRPGLVEGLMAGYVVASLISITDTSPGMLDDTYLLYDRVAVPMMLFLVLRMAAPEDCTIDRWFPVLAVLVLSQAAFGVLSWIAPELLPEAWLNRAGSRTTGSLRHPNVYGISLLFAAGLAFNLGRVAPPRSLRRLFSLPLLLIGVVMAVLTLSRATWLAVLVVMGGIAWMHPRAILKLCAATIPVVMLVFSSGVLGITSDGVSDRFYSSTSEESALSRLPVIVASVRMFEAKPLTGWGYGRFDDFDQEFQESIPGLFVPTKDHASHNLYLTILSEQGIVGLGLYLGPALVLAVRTIRSRRYLPTRRDRLQVATLWFVLGGHLVVTMFSNMRVVFGLGIWWICLGLIAVVTDRAMSERDRDPGVLIASDAERNPLPSRSSS
jgi:O-antigen ligase